MRYRAQAPLDDLPSCKACCRSCEARSAWPRRIPGSALMLLAIGVAGGLGCALVAY